MTMQPTRAELKALTSFCDAERQLLAYAATHKDAVKAMSVARKNALAASRQLLDSYNITCAPLPDELREATGAKYVRATTGHSTKDLSDKFVRATLSAHFDDVKAAVHEVESVDRLADVLRATMWDIFKRERVVYKPTVQFSNNKPRGLTAGAAGATGADEGTGTGTLPLPLPLPQTLAPPLVAALKDMHRAQQDIGAYRARTKELKQRIEEEKSKHIERVTGYMERARLDAQTIETREGPAYTLKYTSMQKTQALSAAQCQEALAAAVNAFVEMHREHMQAQPGGMSADYMAREQESLVELLVRELAQRRVKTQHKVVRLLRKKQKKPGDEEEGGGDDEEEEEGGSGGDSDE